MTHHSALRAPEAVTPTGRVTHPNGSVAFQHDFLTLGLAPEFSTCDILYTEPPWRAGFARFEERAGTPGGDRTYARLMQRVTTAIRSVTIPVFIAIGRADARRLPPPFDTSRIRIPGGSALLLAYRAPAPAGETDADALDVLARQYNRVGDFMCGYGSAGRAFARHRKTFVLSDHNATCIGVIARDINTWYTPGGEHGQEG